MIEFEKWEKIIDYSVIYRRERKLRVKCLDGEIYEGLCDGYFEEEDSNGDNVYALGVGARIFLQEEVRSIEFID